MIKHKKRIAIAMIIISFLIIISVIILFLPRLVIWFETSYKRYDSLSSISGLPQFIDRSGNDVHIITETDNTHIWMKYSVSNYPTVDTNIFLSIDVDNSNYILLERIPLIWWSSEWQEKGYRFNNDLSLVRVRVPFKEDFYPQELFDNLKNYKYLNNKYNFYISKNDIRHKKILFWTGYINYVCIIIDRQTFNVFYWIELS